MAEIVWTPYLEKMRELLSPLDLKEVREIGGEDLSPIMDFRTPKCHGSFKTYRANKIEKLTLGSLYLDEEGHYGMCTIWPQGEYELPLYFSNWEEKAKEVLTLVDFTPTVDLLMNEPYRKKYIDEAISPLWNKFGTLPGIQPAPYAFVRGMCSINYTCAVVPVTNEGMRLVALQPHLEYLKVYLKLLKESESIIEEKRRWEVNRKRAALSHNYRKNFIPRVKKSLGVTMGENMANLLIIMLF
jgi:hypothetical protein